MEMEAAESIHSSLGPDYAGRVSVSDWAGGFYGLEADLPFVTPDGRGSIQMWVGSDDDGRILVEYGDQSYGQYSDDSIELPINESDPAAVAGWIENQLDAFDGDEILPPAFDEGLRRAYADIIDG